MNYATFWQRFVAMWIDFFVLLPIIVLHTCLHLYSKPVALILVLPMAGFYAAYTI
jgi:hypothetical protein